MRLLLATLGCVLGLMASNGHAACQNSDLLIFGNSLSDTGAGYALSPTVTTPPGGQAIPPPPYYNGRYSDGPNWVDYVQQNLDVNVQNFAVGGAETGFGNNYDPIYPMGGFLTQIGRFASAQRPIPKDTTVVVEIGANDFLNLLDSLPVPPTAAQFTLTSLQGLQNTIGGVRALQGLGAERIVLWNLPPLYATPLFNNPFFGNLSLLKPAFFQVTESYNANLLEQVKSQNLLTGSSHKTVFYLDFESMVTEVGQELTAQGIDISDFNIYSQFLNPAIIIPVQAYNPNTAFFDQVHPSTLAWSLLSKKLSAYFDTIDNSHRSISAQTDLTFESWRAYRSLIDNHFRTLHRQFYVCPQTCNDSCNPLQYQVYVDGMGKWGRTKDSCSTHGQRYDTQLFSLGMDYFLNNCLTAGVSFTAQRNNSRLNNDAGSLLLNEYIPTFYATYTDPCMFVDFDVSYSYLYFKKIQRNVPYICRNLHANATGWGIGSTLQGGYLYNCDCITMGPILGLEYESALIHRYNESHKRYPSLTVRGQHQDSLLGKVGWQMFWNKCDCGFSPYADVNYYYDFFNSTRVVLARFRHVYDRSQIRHKIHSNRQRNFLTYNLGVDFGVYEGVTGNVAYQGETTFRHYNNSVIAELNAPF